MTHGSRYRVQLRRRREKKTDYQARKAFVVSGRPRLVARSSLKNTIAQIVIAKPVGDMVLASAHSRELVNKFGWKAATGSIPVAYLTGLLCGLKAKKNGVAEAILDLGLISPTKGAKVFATMSGVVDAGMEIPHAEEKIVKERTRGYHIQDYAESLGPPSEYAPKFSASIAKGVGPEKFSEHFFEVRNAILTAFGLPIPKPETKPVKAKKPEPKPKAPPPTAKVVRPPEVKAEVKPAPVEVKKPEAPAEAVPAPAPKAKPKPKAEEVKHAAQAEEKPKEKAAKAPKAASKKAAPAKAKVLKTAKSQKVEKAEVEPEAKPKRGKKPIAKETKETKPAKKSGSKKA